VTFCLVKDTSLGSRPMTVSSSFYNHCVRYGTRRPIYYSRMAKVPRARFQHVRSHGLVRIHPRIHHTEPSGQPVRQSRLPVPGPYYVDVFVRNV